jgi:hypothetical protein
MLHTSQSIRKIPNFLNSIQQQSAHLLSIHGEKPRLAAIFSSQDRWLMGHIGMALHFESATHAGREGLNAATFIRHVTHHKITTRNTATAFLNEMLNYGIITQHPHPGDRRMRIMAPSPGAIEAMTGWVALHLSTLDAFDKGQRCEWFLAAPSIIARLQPAIAASLLKDETIRNPDRAFAHFMWMNSGFLVTERLIVSLAADLTGGDVRLPITLTSAAELTAGLNLSRSHSARKVSEAEELGILGWTGTKGRSPMWVSRAFVSSFLDIQASKLAIIEDVASEYYSAVPAPERSQAR